MRRSTSEQGQAIVLLALSLVAMLGFAALAIDGGKVLAERRDSQNVADAASLAGAGVAALSFDTQGIRFSDFDCGSYDVQYVEYEARLAAINRAGSNGYTIDADVSDMHGVTTQCVETNTDGYIDKYIDVITYLTTHTETAFAHLIFPGLLESQVEAIARVRPRTPLAFGYAIVALNDSACQGHQNGVVISGNSNVYVDGGGIFSFGCLWGNGKKMETDVTDGNIAYVNELVCHPACDFFSPTPVQVSNDVIPEDLITIPAPDCSGLPNQGQSTGGGTISPGVYSRISLHNGALTMNPGLYCVTDGANALLFTGGTVEGNGVTIFVASGNVSISGNAVVNLVAPSPSPDPSPAIPGVVLYLEEGNSSEVRLEGNSDSMFGGTVYAPDGNIVARGESGFASTPFHTQFIAYNVEFDGNTDLYIEFNSALAYHDPPTLELFK